MKEDEAPSRSAAEEEEAREEYDPRSGEILIESDRAFTDLTRPARRHRAAALLGVLFVAVLAFATGIVLFDHLVMPRLIHGVAEVRVPDLTNLSLEEGEKLLTAVGLRLSRAGRFDRLPSACRAFAQDHVAYCRIGKGEAWLVGDADLLFAPLWRPLFPGTEHLRQADTMEWLAARLWPGAGQAMLRPLWIRSRAA